MLGSGGKTSLLALLARELARRHARVLVSTSTRVYPFPGLPLVEDPAALPAAFARARAVFLGRQLDAPGGGAVAGATGAAAGGEAGKLAGPQPLDPAALRGLADVVLLEADGARGRPLKVHLPHDPLVPAEAELALLVVGASALARPAGDASVHRLEQAPAHWGLRAGETPTPQQVARLLLAADGYLGKTGSVPTRILINQAEAWPAEAARLAAALRAVWPGPILTGSAQRGDFALAPGGGSAPESGAAAAGEPPPAPVALILAAAGGGSASARTSGASRSRGRRSSTGAWAPTRACPSCSASPCWGLTTPRSPPRPARAAGRWPSIPIPRRGWPAPGARAWRRSSAMPRARSWRLATCRRFAAIP